jgi:integrase
MPHRPEPFYRAPRRTWVVEVDNKQHTLGKHPKGQPQPTKGRDGKWNPPPEIWAAFHAKMTELAAAADNVPPAGAQVRPTHPFVATIVDDFAGWLGKRVEEGSKAARTLAWYRKYLTSFLNYLRSLESPPPAEPGEAPLLTIDQLKPSHVYDWVDAQEGWKTGRRGAMTAVQRVFKWAATAGKLAMIGDRSPLASLEKPAQGRREQLVSQAVYEETLSLVRDTQFHDLLELAWNTGARPHELFTVTAAFADLDNARWVFPVQLSKGKRIQRTIYLNDRALEITRRLVQEHPSGPLLRTTTGTAWCASSVKCRFQKLQLALGRKRLKEGGLLPPKIPRLTKSLRQDPTVRREHERKVLERRRQVNGLARQHGIRLNLYSFRHTFVTEALVTGVDAVTVSVLAGHRDTAMISRHYAHLTQRLAHLREAAKRARGG